VAAVTLAVEPGETVALVGPAGSGKSTVLQLAAGWLRPDAGLIAIAGVPASSPLARRLAGYAPADPAFPPALTVREVLAYYASLHGPARSRPGLVAEALEIAALGPLARERVARLTAGARRRLALAQATLGGRRLLLLDDALDGDEALQRRGLRERLGRLAWEGAAIVLASHDLGAVERFADRVIVLRAGGVVRDAAAASLLRDRVLEVVLPTPPAAAPPGFRLAPFGVETDLGTGSVEAALALCRVHRLPVRGSRVRLKTLEDVLLETGDPAFR
jgi:ABC-type multidrug transport system ATPase subunit